MMSLEEKNKEIEKIKAYIDEHQIKNIKLAIVDIDGVLRGKICKYEEISFCFRWWIWFLQCGFWMGF